MLSEAKHLSANMDSQPVCQNYSKISELLLGIADS
jgi:hypothetical protein